MKDFWRGKKVMITGAAGFVGRNLSEALDKLGALSYGLDYRPAPCNLEAAILGDVRDYATIERAVAEFKPMVVFHLAAISQVVDARMMPLQTFQTNILGTANILQAIMQSEQNIAVVVASSDKAYGRPLFLPVNERTNLNPYHPYDVSKAAADFIARSYYETYGLPVSVTRCGNIYGRYDDNWQRIVPGTIRSYLNGERPIIRSDGSQIREYNFADDIIEAYLLVGKHTILSGGSSEAWTISDPDSFLSVVEIINKIGNVIQAMKPEMKLLEPTILSGAKDEEKEIRLDSSRIRRLLHWKPRTRIEDGLQATVNWIAGE